MHINTKKIISLFVLLITYRVYAQQNSMIISGEEFEKYGDRIINEKLFGSDIPPREQYGYIAGKDGIAKIWYFYKIDDDIKCLAYIKRDAANPQNDYILLNTAYQTGTNCKILYGKTIFGQKNPALYFWEGEESASKTSIVDPVSYAINDITYTVDIIRDINELVIANFDDNESLNTNLQSITGLEVFTKLTNITFFDFNEVSLKSLKTNPQVELYFNMCDTITNLRELVYSSQQILQFSIVHK